MHIFVILAEAAYMKSYIIKIMCHPLQILVFCLLPPSHKTFQTLRLGTWKSQKG